MSAMPEDPDLSVLPDYPLLPTRGEAVRGITRDEREELDESLLSAPTERTIAQIVNLHVAGYSLQFIGTHLGLSAAEVDELIQSDAGRYIRNNAGLRRWGRNWMSAKYHELLDSVWDRAVDSEDRNQLAAQDRALNIMKALRTMHGLDEVVQVDVQVRPSDEAVDALVARLAAGAGIPDMDIFDAEVVEEVLAVEAGDAAGVEADVMAESEVLDD